ncbi:putative toxin-antitoxin system toxin component, PIN family [Cyanobium sp. ULC084]|nr:MAG: putative toxin-antitoxin system toxin component, PIN family [Cyanobium sp.]
MHVVLGTNVVVSGILSPTGPPGRLLDLVMDETLQLVVESRILQDYLEVLLRPRFALPEAAVIRLVDNLEDLAIQVLADPWPHPLPDPDDAVFLATAKAGMALLAAGNIAHFPPALRGTIEVLKPRDLINRLDRDELA